jgi:hypothetical protein
MVFWFLTISRFAELPTIKELTFPNFFACWIESVWCNIGNGGGGGRLTAKHNQPLIIQ